MRRGLAAAVLLAIVLPSCGGGSREHTVRVDFQHDEFASHYWRYFPGTVYAHPGDQIVFDQQWTGEPHTVTFGTVADEAIPKVAALDAKYENYEGPETPEALEKLEAEYDEAYGALPTFSPWEADAYPSVTEPCYLRTDDLPEPRAACPRRSQPDFDGRYTLYSSGYIPPSGPAGNVYRVPLADDIEPGSYAFYCVIHFPWMQGKVVVEEPRTELPSGAEINAKARKEIEVFADPLRKAYARALGGRATYGDEALELPLAGYHADEEFTVAIDEFVPRTVRTKVNEPVTWTLVGAHTVSFDVPRYVPIYRVREDGTVERNPVVDRAAGGSPKAPPVDFERHKLEIDGETWDGSGFFSSGLLGSEPFSKYTLRVSKRGRYRFACLVHPNMVGTLVVTD